MKEAKVIIGSDHAGFAVKEKLKKFLILKGYDVLDAGAKTFQKDDDYPDIALTVASGVVIEGVRGILVCKTGTGMMITANKVPGVRAAEGYDVYSAKMSRIDNDSNVLGLRTHGVAFSKIQKIVLTWLKTKFSGAKRHRRRIAKIRMYERKL
jgi:RpiB/LacA/LacB family sugar-phosphate isomerase